MATSKRERGGGLMDFFGTHGQAQHGSASQRQLAEGGSPHTAMCFPDLSYCFESYQVHHNHCTHCHTFPSMPLLFLNSPAMNKKALWPGFGSDLSHASVTQSIQALLVHRRAWAIVSVLEEARDCHLELPSIALLLIF